jgi:uncharacterized protein (DUF1501 family)
MTSDDRRGCAECERADKASTITRRGLLQGLMGAGAAMVALPAFETVTARAAFAAGPAYTGDTIIVVSLRGGFDGLSAIVPAFDPNYAKLRPNIAIPSGSLLQLDGNFGMHPGLSSLKPLWDAGQFGVVHATGMIFPDRSHFSAMAEMENATIGSTIRTGWLDRMLALNTVSGPFGAVQMGSSNIPYSLVGEQPVLAVSSLRDFGLDGVNNTVKDRARWSTALRTLHAGTTAPVLESTTTTLGALDTINAITATNYVPANGASYPNSDLGRSLRGVAQLIKANLGLQVVTLDVDNWDMHSGLSYNGNPLGGWMNDNLNDVGDAFAAFATDLGSSFNNVTMLTMSEFGRRAYENGNNGVDHGWGNAMLVLGGGVNGGKVYGTWPGLDAANLDQGDLKVTTDYRMVLADILANRANASTSGIKAVFPDYKGSSALGLTKPLA